MSLNPDIRDQAYQFFIEEAQELLQLLEDGLLNLREDHSTSKVHELMRAAHSIKGGAASVELDTIKLIAHRLEDFFKALYSEKVEFDTNLETLFLQAYDGLKEPLTEQMELGSFDEEAALLSVEPVFEQLEVLLGDALKEADSYIPSATDLGVDIVASIFEIDVQQCLDRLQMVVQNPQQFDVAEQLREQLDVLSGFAELFTLPGFREIIELGNKAIANNPQQALEIARIVINDCTKAREAILAGERERGGEPSTELTAIAKKRMSLANSEEGKILDALNAAAEQEQSGFVESAPGLEDLFGNNIFDPLSSDAAIEDSEFDAVNDVFGDNLPAFDLSSGTEPQTEYTDKEPAFSEQTPHTELNIFDFAPEHEFQANLDWENIPSEDASAELPTTDEEDIIDYEGIEDLFGDVSENADNSGAFDIIELGTKILNGETVDHLPSSRFSPAEILDTNLEFPPNESEISEIESTRAEPIAKSSLQQPEAEFAPPEDLDTALNSIDDIFDRLPPATPQEIVPEAATISKQTSKEAKKSLDKPQAPINNQLSVRVDLERLERMNNLIGELVINRNSLSLQNEQLQLNVGDLTKKFNRFRNITSKLRELSDSLLVEAKPQNKISSLDTDFDSLEMDSYSHLQLLLQDILEEILQLEESVDDIFLFARQSDRTIDLQSQMLGRMRDELMWARMLPLEQILKRFPRIIRELSNQYQKPVNLSSIGTGVLVDKAVLEKLYDPLLHLLRNGFDHGIETPEIRRQQGKPEQGQIEIHAYYQGNQTIIEVRDDGKGLDTQKIASKAIKKGIISATDAANTPPENLFDLIFEPGFSTAEEVSEISGRGVGMNIVREQIESLKGTITVNSTPGKGSTFILALPLTLTIAKLLVCSLGETAFAFPSGSIEEIIIPLPEQIKTSNDRQFLYWKEELISIYKIKDILEYNCAIIPLETSSRVFESVNAPQDWALPLLLLRRGRQFFALEVDRLITEQELVIKPFGKTLTAPSYTYGCTILGDGTLIPVLNGITLIGQFLGETPSDRYAHPVTIQQPLEPKTDTADSEIDLSVTEDIIPSKSAESRISTVTRSTIMIVDDSTALRRTMALSLERQGYNTLQAKDGRDAIEQLRKTSGVDLIVCDVEMPHMNGFEFLGVRRRDSELKDIPVIMLTSRSGMKHRNLANQLGANGYFTKPYVEQEFIKELDKILGRKPVRSQDTLTKNSRLTNKHKILIVDDSSALRRTMCLSLETKGYRVLEARDGEEGLEQMYQNPDLALVICDIEMPKMNGFELLTSRRQDPQLQKIPVAMLTSRSNKKHQDLANKLGANAYFTKPYTEGAFMREIENLIKSNILKS